MRVSRKRLAVPVFAVALGFASATANAATLEQAAQIKEATASTEEVAVLAVTKVDTGIVRKFEVVALNSAQVRKTAWLLWDRLAAVSLESDPDDPVPVEWTVDVGGSSAPGGHVEIASEDFLRLIGNPQEAGMQLFFSGKLKVSGDPMLAMKLQALFKDDDDDDAK